MPVHDIPYSHIKTTVELPDALFAQAKRHAKARNTTMKALIEEGLRTAMAEKAESPPFRLRDGSFHGQGGLAPAFRGAGWEQIRDAIYSSEAPPESGS
ncbi:MAG: hypothetical protein QM674_01530 [Burkholderiaceae bacterium]